jgi:hypothetical protein
MPQNLKLATFLTPQNCPMIIVRAPRNISADGVVAERQLLAGEVVDSNHASWEIGETAVWPMCAVYWIGHIDGAEVAFVPIGLNAANILGKLEEIDAERLN